MEEDNMEIDAARIPQVVIAPPPPPKTQPKQADVKADVQQTAETQNNQSLEAYVKKQVKHKEDEASSRMLHSAIDTANKQLINAKRMLQASVHETTNRLMVKVIDTETEEVVREIPPEKTLDLFAKVLEMAGILLDEKK
jgi:flagellar protein FlaG